MIMHAEMMNMDNEHMQDLKSLTEQYQEHNKINPKYLKSDAIKFGLRNADGSGVVAGVTKICNVHGYIMNEGEKVGVEGELTYRGIPVQDIINGCAAEERYSFEETAFLLLMGYLPNRQQTKVFYDILAEYHELPENFTEDIIMKVASPNIMNMLARSVLALYTYDPNPEDTSLDNVMRQSMELLARMPAIIAASYQVRRRIYDNKSMYLHNPKPDYSTSQNLLRMLRSNKTFTEEEARLLDLCLTLHSEHGGGNNSTFAVRVLSSSKTDTYSAIAGGIGSLKGPRHGGANYKVIEQLEYLKGNIRDWKDDDEIREYLRSVLKKEAGDRSGLIYGMGHAVYTLSDPRAKILKANALKVAEGTDYYDDFMLLDAVERLTPDLLREKWGTDRPVCANIDLYSGLVYRMLGIPDELHTAVFASARTAGWCAHRLEELNTGSKLIRPAYRPTPSKHVYVPLEDR